MQAFFWDRVVLLLKPGFVCLFFSFLAFAKNLLEGIYTQAVTINHRPHFTFTPSCSAEPVSRMLVCAVLIFFDTALLVYFETRGGNAL